MKQRKIAIKAEYRKDSEAFPEWLKYEVTILKDDGTTEKVPAYGKDLQDALSRVVHDEKVKKVGETTKKIPDIVWAVLWFGYMLGLVNVTYLISGDGKFNGIFFVGGLAVLSLGIWRAESWLRMRNQDRI